MRKDYSLTPTTRDGKPRRPIEIAMTPMSDVIFLLRVFFLATSSFQLVEQLMPSGVSETEDSAGNSEAPPPEVTDDALDQIVVKLQQEGDQVFAVLNEGKLANWQELQVRFRTIGSVGSDPPVIIDPAAEVQADYFVQAYDWARESGLSRVYLAIRK